MSSRFDSLTKICTLIVSWHRVFGGVCCFYGHLLWIKFSTSYSKQSKKMAHRYHCKSFIKYGACYFGSQYPRFYSFWESSVCHYYFVVLKVFQPACAAGVILGPPMRPSIISQLLTEKKL